MSVVSTAAAIDREQTILTHMAQVRLLAFRAYQRCPSEVELDDLISAGRVGLLQAVERFEPGRNLKLKTLAEHRIRGAILDYLRGLDPMPRAARQFQRQREEASLILESRLERRPSESETANVLGCSLKRYRQVTLVVRAASVISLDSPTDERTRPLQVATPEPSEPEDDRLAQRLQVAIARLPRRERAIIRAFLRGQTPSSSRPAASHLREPRVSAQEPCDRSSAHGIRSFW